MSPCKYWLNVRWLSVRWLNVRWLNVRWLNVPLLRRYFKITYDNFECQRHGLHGISPILQTFLEHHVLHLIRTLEIAQLVYHVSEDLS